MTPNISSHLMSAVLCFIAPKFCQLFSPPQSYISNTPQYIANNLHIFNNKIKFLKKDAGFHESNGSQKNTTSGIRCKVIQSMSVLK